MKGRTLYLNSLDKALTVEIDGDSLSYIEKRDGNMCAIYIPLRQISRAVIFGNMDIPTDLLAKFSEFDIPVLIITEKQNKPIISISMNYTHMHDNNKLMNIIGDKKEALAKLFFYYRKLYQHMTLKIINKGLRLNLHEIKDKTYRELISQVTEKHQPQWETIRTLIHSLFFGYCIDVAIKYLKINPHQGIINQMKSFGFVKDMLFSLNGEIDYQSILFFSTTKISALKPDEEKLFSTPNILKIISIFEERIFVSVNFVKELKNKIAELERVKNAR